MNWFIAVCLYLDVVHLLLLVLVVNVLLVDTVCLWFGLSGREEREGEGSEGGRGRKERERRRGRGRGSESENEKEREVQAMSCIHAPCDSFFSTLLSVEVVNGGDSWCRECEGDVLIK